MSDWAVSWRVLWIAFGSVFRNKWDISGPRMGDGETAVQGTGQQIQGMWWWWLWGKNRKYRYGDG